jgi:uncharacterized membrane protein
VRNHSGLSGRIHALKVIVVFILGGAGSAIVQSLLGVDLPVGSAAVAFGMSVAIIGLGTSASRLNGTRPWMLATVLTTAFIAGVASPSRPAAAVAGAVAVVAISCALPSWRHPYRFLPWSFVAVACATVVGVEILYIADDLRGSPWERMNTVFKFYLQVWILLAIGCAMLLAKHLHRPAGESLQRKFGALIMSASLSIVVVAGSIYPVLGTPARLSQSMPGSPSGLTLDGYSWMNNSWIHNGTGDVITFGDDLRVIEWLNKNVTGTPVILEASIGPYRGNGSRISSATGLPTVLGWDRHQRQQRQEPGISQRMLDVRAIYNEANPQHKLEMLRSYDVRFIVVGDVERLWNTPDQPAHYSGPEGIAAFADMVGSGLSVAYVAGDTIVYQVDDFERLEPAVPR